VISALNCVVVAVLLSIQISANGNISYIVQAAIGAALTLSLLAGLLTVSFRMLNGGADVRRVSAIVLVFLLSIIGIALSQIIGAAFGFLIDWLLNIWIPLDAFIFIVTYETLGYTNSAYALTYFSSWSMVLSIAVLGAMFGLPLARIGNGIRFADAWNQQVGKKWILFKRCGAGALGLWVIWAAVSLIAHSIFVAPTLTKSEISVSDGSINQLTFYQPTLLETSFGFGMNLMLFSLAVGFVAYSAEQVRQQFG
jgi:hypothetical protein